jgi:hypothetical protein
MFKGTNRKFLYIVVITMALLLALTSIATAAVWTDKPDYVPGSTVTISGGNDDSGAPGYYSGGMVDVAVTGPHDPAYVSTTCQEVPVGADGSWSCTVKLWADPEWAVGTYYYAVKSTTEDSAAISESGTFTDKNATVSGSVKDSSNNPIEGALVKCISEACNPSDQDITNASGLYSFQVNFSQSPTSITLEASKTGYTSASLPAFDVSSGVTYPDKNFILATACTAPTISAQPVGATKTVGESVTFSVTASGTSLTYQWRKGGVAISGATSSSYTISSVVVANAGDYDVVVTNGCGSEISNTAVLTVNKANATCSVTAYSLTYDGNTHTATGTCTGVGGSEDVLSGLDLSGTTHTNAGFYEDDPWTFTDVTSNYNDASGTVDDNIDKAEADCTVTPYDVIYDGDPHTATGKCHGVKGESLSGLDLSGTTHTNADFYEDDLWTFTDATGNYNDTSGTVDDNIDKAEAECKVTGYNVVYDRVAHTASGACTGVKSETLSGLNLDGTTHSNPGDYPDDPWTFTDVTGNYNDKNGTVHDNIHYQIGGLCNGAPNGQVLQPVNFASPYSIFKKGSTVPVKFRVCDAYGVSVGPEDVVDTFTLVSVVKNDLPGVIEPILSTTPDTSFRWDPVDQQWIFNLSTKNLTAGYSYYYEIMLKDGNPIDFHFTTK